MTLLLVHSEGPRGYWSDVVTQLQAAGVVVTAATSYRPDEHRAQLRSHGAEDFPLLDVRRLFDPDEAAQAAIGRPPPRGPAFQEAAEASLRDFLDITDRSAFLPVSVRYRTRLYRTLVRYWDGFLEAHPEVETVLFTDVPHHGWDLVLFEVARARGLATPSIATTSMGGRLFLREDYRAPPEPPDDFLAEESREDLLARLSPDVREALGGKSRLIARVRSLIDQPQDEFEVPEDAARGGRSGGGLGKALQVLARGGRNLLGDLFTGEFEYATALNGIRARVVRKALRQVQRWRFHQLRQALHARARSVPAGSKYAVFLMHIQPERTTSPEAGRYTDLVLAVETLAAGLPEGWVLAVREHPRQLEADGFNYLQTQHFRTPADYAALDRIPGVVLTPPDQSVDELLAGASLVSTATGTAGWEGLTLGKPVVAFGYPWYAGCASTYRGDLPGQVEAAFAAAQATDAAAQVGRDLLVYLAWLEARWLRGVHCDFVLDAVDVPQPELVAGMVDGILAYLGQGSDIGKV